jgi:hypothetical protein
MHKYSLLSYDKDENITQCYPFESQYNDCHINVHTNERTPFPVGSNQRIISWEEDGPIWNDVCDFCGHESIVREYFKVDLDLDIMDAFGFGRYGMKFCANTCYKKIDKLMHTDKGTF